MRARQLVPVAFLAGGIATLVFALASGGASAGVFVIFPFVIGNSPILLGAIALFVLGFLTLPLLSGDARLGDRPGERGVTPAGTDHAGSLASAGSEGVILVGPFPIFFGAWRNPGARRYWLAAFLGLVFLVVALVLAGVLRL